MGMFTLNPLWITLFLNWVYIPPTPPPALSAAQEARFQRIFQWDATRPGEVPAVMQAIKAGDLQRLKYLQTQGAYIPPQLAMQWANAYGHLPIVQWLLTQEAQLIPTDYGLALDSGNAALITWWQQQPLYTQTLMLTPSLHPPLVSIALRHGHVKATQMRLDQGDSLPDESSQQSEILFDLICNGHAEMFQWLTQKHHWKLSSEDAPSVYDEIMILALSTGNLTQARHLITMGYPQERLPDKAHFLIYAAHGGDLQTVQWLVKQGVPLQPPEREYHYLNDRKHVLGLAIKTFCQRKDDNTNLYLELQPTAREEALTQNHVHLARWLEAQGAQTLSEPVQRQQKPNTFTSYQMRNKIQGYLSLEVAQQLRNTAYENFNDRPSQNGSHPSLFLTAILSEHLPMVQYMLLRYPSLLDNPDVRSELFLGYTREDWHQELLGAAVSTHSMPLIHFLLKQGLDPLLIQDWDSTHLNLAIELQNHALYRFIREREKQLQQKKAPATAR